MRCERTYGWLCNAENFVGTINFLFVVKSTNDLIAVIPDNALWSTFYHFCEYKSLDIYIYQPPPVEYYSLKVNNLNFH